MALVNPWSNFTTPTFENWGYKDQMRTIFGDINYIDPYTTGYHYIFFTLPNGLDTRYGRFLTTVCQSVTIPGISVNKIAYNGLNNMEWNVPGTVEYESHSITCKFIEFAGLPIIEIMGNWVSIIRNMLYGVASSTGTPDSGGIHQADYKGRILYATTRMDGLTVQFASVFTGVFPLKVPLDRMSSDKTSHEKVEPEIEFAFDLMYTGEAVTNNAQSLISSTYSSSVDAVNQAYNNASSTINS